MQDFEVSGMRKRSGEGEARAIAIKLKV